MYIDPERILQIQDSQIVQCFLCKIMSSFARDHADDNPLWWVLGLATCSTVLSRIIEADFDVTKEKNEESLEEFALHVKKAMDTKAGRLNPDEVKYIGTLSEKIVDRARDCLKIEGTPRR